MFPLWDEVVRSRRFWLDYVRAGVDVSQCPTLASDVSSPPGFPVCGVMLTFLLPEPYLLRVEVEGAEHRLKLSRPGAGEFTLLGNMDAHQMSDLFRWDEFEAVVAAMAGNPGPTWAHALLLSPYVAVTDDCAGRHAALVRRCLEDAGVFDRAEVEYIIDRIRGGWLRADFRWVETPDLGRVAEGRQACSLRRRDNAPFDFAGFRAFMASVGA